MKEVELIASFDNTLTVESQSIAAIKNTVDKESMLKCLRIISDCRGKILIAGVGTSMAAARKIAHSLCCIERPASFLSPGDGVHGGLGVVQSDDVVIAISKGGSTREILNIVSAINSKGACLIAVTENEDSLLARNASLVLKIKVDREPDEFNMLATASTLAVIAVFDAICIGLMKYTGYSREQFAVIHPGGAVGDRLLAGEK